MKFVWFIIAIQVLLTGIAIVIIGYLIIRRIKLRKREDFEKRE
jgi:putative effector of murein hydrolase